ncbi:YlbE-like family protein [Bacillus fonticola]|uniref:YlbE-like family protein n=1 Tax=Bacillus fonticola TaxID=2728853 RepID=UPI001476245D|nr:YlbE-like family protein [Bacillus fonticola]
MRQDLYRTIKQNEEWLRFLREQPIWYRKLMKRPEQLQQLEVDSLHYFQKTIPHRVQKFSSGVQMATMMMSMFQTMNQSNEASQ